MRSVIEIKGYQEVENHEWMDKIDVFGLDIALLDEDRFFVLLSEISNFIRQKISEFKQDGTEDNIFTYENSA